MSIWSCKHYNPEAEITIVTDESTFPHLEKYPELVMLATKVSIHEFSPGISNFERSRSLKTRLRFLIEGDYLFVDTDTIFCDTICEIDLIQSDIAIVEDLHVPFLLKHPLKKNIINRTESVYGDISVSEGTKYFNSGVIYSKDTDLSKHFYHEWNSNWELSKNKTNRLYDQPALLKTIIDNPNYVKTLEGIYNVQLAGSIRYLFDGKILHFFNFNINGIAHPFWNKEYYNRIKETLILSENVKADILNCKSLFAIPTCIIGPEESSFWKSKQCQILMRIQQHRTLKKFFSLLLKGTDKMLHLTNQ